MKIRGREHQRVEEIDDFISSVQGCESAKEERIEW